MAGFIDAAVHFQVFIVKPKALWVYDKGVLLNGSPFSSFASAIIGESIGYSKKQYCREIYFLFKTTKLKWHVYNTNDYERCFKRLNS